MSLWIGNKEVGLAPNETASYVGGEYVERPSDSPVGSAYIPTEKPKQQSSERNNFSRFNKLTKEEALALGRQPVGEPAIGSQLYYKTKYLQSSTARWSSEQEFTRGVESVSPYLTKQTTFRGEIIDSLSNFPRASGGKPYKKVSYPLDTLFNSYRYPKPQKQKDYYAVTYPQGFGYKNVAHEYNEAAEFKALGIIPQGKPNPGKQYKSDIFGFTSEYGNIDQNIIRRQEKNLPYVSTFDLKMGQAFNMAWFSPFAFTSPARNLYLGKELSALKSAGVQYGKDLVYYDRTIKPISRELSSLKPSYNPFPELKSIFKSQPISSFSPSQQKAYFGSMKNLGASFKSKPQKQKAMLISKTTTSHNFYPVVDLRKELVWKQQKTYGGSARKMAAYQYEPSSVYTGRLHASIRPDAKGRYLTPNLLKKSVVQTQLKIPTQAQTSSLFSMVGLIHEPNYLQGFEQTHKQAQGQQQKQTQSQQYKQLQTTDTISSTINIFDMGLKQLTKMDMRYDTIQKTPTRTLSREIIPPIKIPPILKSSFDFPDLYSDMKPRRRGKKRRSWKVRNPYLSLTGVTE